MNETRPCKRCGRQCWEDEIFGVYCRHCLRTALTTSTFFEFAEYNDKLMNESDVHTVEHFMVVWFYGVSEKGFTSSSKEFRALMQMEFSEIARAHNLSVIYDIDDGFVTEIWKYLEDYRLLNDFALWLEYQSSEGE